MRAEILQGQQNWAEGYAATSNETAESMSKMLRLEMAQLKAIQDRLAKNGVVTEHTLDGSQIKQRSKYGNKKFSNTEGQWDSLKEYNRCRELRILESAGRIEGLERQVPFQLLAPFAKDGKRLRSIQYIADFVYFEEGIKVVEDVKGFRNELYKLKKRLMWQLLGIEIFET